MIGDSPVDVICFPITLFWTNSRFIRIIYATRLVTQLYIYLVAANRNRACKAVSVRYFFKIPSIGIKAHTVQIAIYVITNTRKSQWQMLFNIIQFNLIILSKSYIKMLQDIYICSVCLWRTDLITFGYENTQCLKKIKRLNIFSNRR